MMKRIFFGVVVLACAYGILIYATSNPNGAKMLREDIDAAVEQGVEAAREGAESAKRYVDNLLDEEQQEQ